jgi:hypothetical protein
MVKLWLEILSGGAEMVDLTRLILALTHLNDGCTLSPEEMAAITQSQKTIEAAWQAYLHRVADTEAEERKRAIDGTSWLGPLLKSVEQLLALKFRRQIKLEGDAIKSIRLLAPLDEKTDPHVIGFLKVNGAIITTIEKKAKKQLAEDDGVKAFLVGKGFYNLLEPTPFFEIEALKLIELYRNIVAGNVPELQPDEGANGPTLEPIMTEETKEPPEHPYTVG